MIIILDNYDSFTYNLYQSVAQMAPAVKVFRNDKISITEIMALNPTGIIISPGPGRPENNGIGIELVQSLAEKIPILGVCLGHQMITVAFGGKVQLADKAIHGKEAYIFHHRQDLYKNMTLPFRAGRYHSLIAERTQLPDELIIEAEGSDGMIMGIRHKTFPTYGVQFHPESILTPEGEMLLKNFIDICYRNSTHQEKEHSKG